MPAALIPPRKTALNVGVQPANSLRLSTGMPGGGASCRPTRGGGTAVGGVNVAK
jgi:hypothetical protein